ncbi:MAG: hypothetical protein Q8R28_11855 [Dehalococcoidia bacterium]|nr:hypothetical protein [Dehalococcoidia bacterium]
MMRRKAFLLEALLLLVVVLVAAVLRLYGLDDIPPGLHGDEALTGLDAQTILNEGWIGPYTGHALGQPTGPLLWTALVFKLFGTSIFTLRASMAVLAVLTVPAADLFFRTAFNPRVALIGASLLTLSYWRLRYSRRRNRQGVQRDRCPLFIAINNVPAGLPPTSFGGSGALRKTPRVFHSSGAGGRSPCWGVQWVSP